MFKVGDYVEVKPNTEIETGEVVDDWSGEVVAIIGKEEKFIEVALDAPTLLSLSEEYVLSAWDNGLEYLHYVFSVDDLQAATKRRDTDRKRQKAIKKLQNIIIEYEEEEEQESLLEAEKWRTDFAQSSFFDVLSEKGREYASFVVQTFQNYMYEYLQLHPDEWSAVDVKEVCLDIVPTKITAEIEFFEQYGSVLIQFLRFLGSEKHIKNAHSLIRTVEKIKSKIPKIASDSSNWGPAKSMMMAAENQGIDLDDEQALNQFLKQQQEKALRAIQETHTSSPPLNDPYKNIGRNEKVTVRFANGNVLEHVKFKNVAADLRNGNCELLSSPKK